MSFELPLTWRDYYVLVKEPELVARAMELGWNNFVLFEGDKFTDEEIEEIIRTHRNIVKFHLDPGKQRGLGPFNRLQGLDIYFTSYNPYRTYKYNDEEIKTFSDVLESLPRIINRMEFEMLRNGISWCSDYEDRCGNCRMLLEKDDKYCKHCGTKRGHGKFIPYRTNTTNTVLYGAPGISRKFKCSACGNIWETINDFSLFCPKCGCKDVKLIEEKEEEHYKIWV